MRRLAALGATAMLSEPADCTRVTDHSLQVFEMGLRVEGCVTCAGTEIAFHPFLGLPTDTQIQAFLAPTVRDLDGYTLGTQVAWSFSLAPWTRQLGTSSWDQGLATATDAAANVYVAGRTQGDLDGNVCAGGDDLLVMKFDATGAKQWTRQLGTSSDDGAAAAATDAAGNVYVAGYTNGGLDGNTSAGSFDLLLVKYDGAGAKQWTRQLGTSSDDGATAVATDAAGNVYLAGHTNGSLDGNASAGTRDLYLVKYGGTGVKHWTRQLGTSSYEHAAALATDAAGNAYVAGSTRGGLDGNTNAGEDDLFLVKYDGTGAKQWTRQLGTPEFDVAYSLATSASGDVYAAGATRGPLDGNASAGSMDLFLVKYQQDGRKR